MIGDVTFISYTKICLGIIKREKLDPKKFTLVDVYAYYMKSIPVADCIKELSNK